MQSARQEALARARRHALNLLARREHSHAELSRKLGSRGHAPEIVSEVLEDLATVGLFSEARFAAVFVAGRISRGQGPRLIRAELRRRGLGGEAVERALDDAEADWLALARQVRERRFGTAAPADARERAKQMRFLEQRGFGYDEIHTAVPPVGPG